MALLWFDGMDRYDSAAVLQRAYTSSPDVQFATGRFGGRALLLPKTFNSNPFHPPTFEPSTTVYVGFALKLGGLSRFPLMFLGDSGGGHANCFSLYVTANGQFEFYGVNSLLGYSTQSIAPAVWYYIDMMLRIETSGSGTGGAGGGEVQVRVNEIDYIHVGSPTLGIDTTLGGLVSAIDSLYWQSSNTNASDVYLDDMSIINQRGNTNNSLPGDSVVESFFPTGASVAGWQTSVPGAQTWTMLSDVPPDDDATYSYTPDSDSYERLLSHNPTIINQEVYGLRVSALARKDTNNFAAIIPFWDNFGPGTVYGPQTSLTTNYMYYSVISGYQGDVNYNNFGQPLTQASGTQNRYDLSQIQGFDFGAIRRD